MLSQKSMIVLMITFLLFIGCRSLEDYVAKEDPPNSVGWVNPHTYQFWVHTQWNNSRYYLQDYESARGRTPVRFTWLKKKYSYLFRKEIIHIVSQRFSEMIFYLNTDLSSKEWKKVIFTELNRWKDFNFFLAKEEYFANGKIRYLVQIKKNGLKNLIECHLPRVVWCG